MNILFIDDDPCMLRGLRRALRPRKEEWNMRFEVGGHAGWQAFKRDPAQIVVTDLRMPDIDGLEVLRLIKAHKPETIRIVLSGFADLDVVIKSVHLAHQFMTKPCAQTDLIATLDRVANIANMLGENDMDDVAALDQLPACPAIYTEVTDLLLAGAEPAKIANTLEKDPAMSLLLLKVVNSAFVGLSRPVSTVSEAVFLLGTRMVRDIVLCAGAARSIGNVPTPVIESFQQHSLRVAQLVAAIAPRSIAHDARTAAFMHDLGSLFLWMSRPDQLTPLIERAHEQAIPLIELQRAAFHMTHADIGGFILGLWGLPRPVVNGVGAHHRPDPAASETMTVSTVLHIADALIHEISPPQPWSGFAQLDEDLITSLGLEDSVDRWRELALDKNNT